MLDNSPDTGLSELQNAAPLRDSSDARIPLLAFVADDGSEAAIRAGLVNTVEGLEIQRGTILHAIRYLAKKPTPRVLIVDITDVDSPLEELGNLAHVCTPDVKVLVIGEESGIAFYRNLVRNMGVAEYVHKPLTRDHVSRLLVPQIAGITVDPSASQGGNVIAVCGAR
jgi:pilus assembly protein CpaE